MKGKYLSGFLLFISSIGSFAQGVRIHGFIKDYMTKATLVQANVFSSAMQNGAYTNNEGYFTMVVKSGITDTMYFSYVGYKTRSIEIETTRDTLISVLLFQDTLSTIEVTANKDPISQLNLKQIRSSKLSEIPMLMGERDIYSALNMTAGVNFGVEGKAEINVRGGTNDQNLILYDDIPLYSSGHLLGFISIFNPLSVKSVNFYKGQFPARFGSRLSSVVEVISEDGNPEKFSGGYSFGLVNSQANINGPLGDKLTFSLSGRIANFGLILLPLKVLYDAGTGDTYGNFIMNDFNFKTNLKLDEYHRLTLSLLRGSDNGTFLNKDLETVDEFKSQFFWQNKLYALKYMGTFSPSWYVKSNLFLSDYNNSKKLDNTKNDEVVFRYEDKSDLQEFGFRLDNEISLSNRTNIEIGMYASRFDNRSNEVSVLNTDDGNRILSPGGRNRLNTLAWYANGLFNGPSKRISVGFRWNTYYNGNFSESFLEPRLSYVFEFGQSFISLAYAKLSQPLHQTNGLSNDLPVSSWVVSQESLPVSTSDNFSISFDSKVATNTDFSCGIYWRDFSNLSDFPLGTEYVLDIQESLVDRLEKEGKGQAYGLEVEFARQYRKLLINLSGTISRSRRRFATINDNEWYRSQYQRDYSLKGFGIYRLNSRHSFSSNVVWSSGVPVTYPEGFAATHPDFSQPIIPIYSRKHNANSPAYFRIDVQYKKEYKTKKGRKAHLNVGVYNISGRYNPLTIEVYPKYITEANSNTIAVEGKIRKTTFFNFIPYITLGREF